MQGVESFSGDDPPESARSSSAGESGQMICSSAEAGTHSLLPNSQDGWFAGAMATDLTFPRITPHDLRHTAASLAISACANVKAVQRMLGHASAAMTLDTYAALFDDDLDYVAKALSSARRTAVVEISESAPDASARGLEATTRSGAEPPPPVDPASRT